MAHLHGVRRAFTTPASLKAFTLPGVVQLSPRPTGSRKDGGSVHQGPPGSVFAPEELFPHTFVPSNG